MVPRGFDCPLHNETKAEISLLRDDIRKLHGDFAGLKCSEYNVRLSKMEEDMSAIKREIDSINKERYTARGVIILLAAVGSMIGSLIVSYVK